MEVYKENEIWQMSAEEFRTAFLLNHIVIELRSSELIDGVVKEIGLSANKNLDYQNHLPVSLKVNMKNYDIQDIKLIKVY